MMWWQTDLALVLSVGAYAGLDWLVGICRYRWRLHCFKTGPHQVGAWVRVKHSLAGRLARIVEVDPPTLTGRAWCRVVFVDPPVEENWCWPHQLEPATPTDAQVAAWLIYELETA